MGGQDPETVSKRVCVGLLAHVDAGKTTITEQLLYQSGALRQAGRVDNGTAQTDFLQVERDRGISVRASSAAVIWNGVALNLIDTPGHVDFAAEVERALAVLDLAVLVISAPDGIQSHTEVLYEALRASGTEVVVFLNKIDQAGSRTGEVLQELRERFGLPVLCCTELKNECGRNCACAARTWEDPGFCEEACEVFSEWDDSFLERYLSGERIEAQELDRQMKEQLAAGRFLPVLCGSGLLGVGIRELLDFVTAYGSPVKSVGDGPLSAVVYRVTHDKTMGRIAHVRLFGGAVKNRDSVPVSSQPEPVKISQIRRYFGSRFADVGQAQAGDVVALCGMSGIQVGDIIGEYHGLAGSRMAVPLIKVRVIPQDPAQLYELYTALDEIAAEDPKLNLEYYPEEQEISISIMGRIQLEVLSALLRERYGLTVTYSQPTVIYQETPAKKGVGFDAYTMPKPCWAVIELEIEPGPRGSGLEYRSIVPNDQIFYRYQHHIETELPRALKQGLYNWEVTDLKVTLTGGSHHTVHTHPLDFFLATPLALMNGLQNTGTILLEPVELLRVAGPEEYLGKVIGDMVSMRGQYDAPVLRKGEFVLEAQVPAAESMEYAIRLASMTSGKGSLSTRFLEYRPCPEGFGRAAKRHGVDPRDRDRWILSKRNAMG